jgi:hypothetical protein
VVVAVLCGTGQAGARYFYCEALGLSASDPCAASSRAEERCPVRSLDGASPDCCSVVILPAVPHGVRAGESTVHPASVVALRPGAAGADTRSDVGESGFGRRGARWQKPPRPGRERRARLMVFLT